MQEAVSASSHLQALNTVEGLIAASRNNVKHAQELARVEYPELTQYLAEVPTWAEKYSSSSHYGFWKNVFSGTKSLVERITAHETQGLDTAFEEKPLPKCLETAKPKSWADYTSSDEEVESETNYLRLHAEAISTSTGICIPSDLETVWPKGYTILTNAAKTYGFEVIKDPLTMARAGFKGAESLSTDGTVAREAFARLSADEQKSINMLKSLFVFLRLTPDEALAQDAKFAITAGFVLHFLLLTGDAEFDGKIMSSLKHRDGGRSIILARIQQLFLTDRAVADILLISVEKIYRAIAKSERQRRGGISAELKKLITDACFTSPEGMLENYYTRERKEVNRMVDEVDRTGRTRKVKKSFLVNGFRVPTLCLGEELLKSSEKAELKRFEHRWSMPNLARTTTKRFNKGGGAPENLTVEIRNLVREAYRVSTLVTSIVKSRKQKVRAEALSTGATNNKLTPTQWLAAATAVLEKERPIPTSTYEEIEGFLDYWERE